MLRAQVISQQNTQTENQNVVTMCHIKDIFKNSIKIENIENIRYFRRKISDIYPIYINDIYIYIGDIYRANPGDELANRRAYRQTDRVRRDNGNQQPSAAAADDAHITQHSRPRSKPAV